MKILISPDKFKGTLTAAEAAEAIGTGCLRTGDPELTVIPMADGGEGTLDALAANMNGYGIIPTVDALMRPVECRYGIMADATVVIEAASCIGLGMLEYAERDPLRATSFGLGLTIAGLIDGGYRNFIVALGGSATDDGGAGMAAALGARFFDSAGKPIEIPTGESLTYIARVEWSAVDSLTSDCSFTALCDVRNPLLGPDGATMVYAEQKGADRYARRKLEKGKCRLAGSVGQVAGRNTASAPFAGAAGGLGWAMMTFVGAEAVSGAEYVGAANSLAQAVEASDLVISGEGRIDAQTADGKTVDHVARLAQKYDKRLLLFCGRNDSARQDCHSLAERFGAQGALRNSAARLAQLVGEVMEGVNI